MVVLQNRENKEVIRKIVQKKELCAILAVCQQLPAGRRREDSQDYCATKQGNHSQALAAICGGAAACLSFAWEFVASHICRTERVRYGAPSHLRWGQPLACRSHRYLWPPTSAAQNASDMGHPATCGGANRSLVARIDICGLPHLPHRTR
jgi:hypothetical protein